MVKKKPSKELEVHGFRSEAAKLMGIEVKE